MINPRVCVLICTHNYGRFLKCAIDAALNQTYKNISICVIDDGSTDNTQTVLQNYIPFDTDRQDYDDGAIRSYYTTINGVSLTVILKPTCTGPSHARNIGIRATIDNTDVYVIADADDEMLPTKVEKLVQMWDGQENVGIVCADYTTLNEQGYRTREYKPIYSWELLKRECCIHSNSLITKKALESVKEGDDYYCSKLRTCEDWDLELRICEKLMCLHLAESLTTVRTHSQDSTHTVKSDVWNQNYAMVMQRLNERQAKGV
mgnify:CR=1 FL=1